MKVKIKKDSWVKQTEEVEIDLPEQVLYIWHNGSRVAYCVKPIFTTWNKERFDKEEEIYEYAIVKVDPSVFGGKIERFKISVSSIPDILKDSKNENLRLVEDILEGKSNREKDRFEFDYKGVLDRFNEIVE